MSQIRRHEVPSTVLVEVPVNTAQAVRVPVQHDVYIGHPTERVHVWWNAGTAGLAPPSSSANAYDFVPAGNRLPLSLVGPAYPESGEVTLLVSCPDAQGTVYVPVRAELPEVRR